MPSFYELKARATKAERDIENARNKAASAELAPSTRRGYSKKLPQCQKALLAAREELNDFIDSQRHKRGLKPRDYGIKRVRNN